MSDSVPFPKLAVALGGRWLSPDELSALAGVRVQQRLSLPVLCELYFNDSHGPIEAMEAVKPGTRLKIEIGGYAEPLFVGDVTAVELIYTAENEREVYLRAYDPLHRLRKRQSVDVLHADIRLEAAVRDLCKRGGIETVSVPSTGLQYPLLIPFQPTDLDFLTAAAARAGLYLAMRGETLHLVDLRGFSDPPLLLTRGENLTAVRFEINGDAACDSVQVQGWDLRKVELQSGRARSARSGRAAPAKIDVGALGGDGARRLFNQSTADRKHAEELAQAELDRRAASEVVLWGEAAGHPGLRPGAPVKVQGVASAVGGQYVLTTALHTIDGKSGYVTEFNSEPPDRPAFSPSTTATFGEVTAIDDPDGLGRVRARLPAFGGVGTGWMPVLFPGAGAGKGLVTLPDPGDTVLIVLLNGDPAQGVVLGGVYGGRRTPDSGVSLGRAKRYTWTTPGNQKVQLNDNGDVIRLENGDGSFIELAGGEITIAGKKIDFRHT